MGVAAEMIFYQIKQKIPSVFGGYLHNREVERPIFPASRDKNRKHIIVISRDESEQFVAHADYPMLLYAGLERDQAVRLSKLYPNALFLPRQYTVPQIFNLLTEFFDLYEEWYQELEEATNHYYNYHSILTSTESLTDAPIALIDTQFRYVSYTKRMAYLAGFDKYVHNANYLPLEDINYLNSLPDYKELEQEKGVFHYVAVEDLLHKNVFYKDNYIARLSIPYSRESYINDFHGCVLTILSEYIETLYDRFGTFRRLEKQDEMLKEMLTTLLDQKNIKWDHMKSLLVEKAYQPEDQYVLIQFTSGFTNNNEDTAKALASRLEMQAPGITCIHYQGTIYALVNRSHYERADQEPLMQRLACYLRDSLLQAGVSRQFTDLHTLYGAYRQTQIAIEFGTRMHPTIWCYRFDDYAFAYLRMHGLNSFLPEQVCHQGILNLQKYDQEHGTELNKTLRTFMEIQYNASECARLLYVNRSSFLKRLERIEQLTKINLKDFKERSYLELSYLLIEEG